MNNIIGYRSPAQIKLTDEQVAYVINATRQVINEKHDLIRNILSSRQLWLEGSTNDSLDRRRSINDECGYPNSISPEQYWTVYRRDPLAGRVCEAWAKEMWKHQPTVYENEDPEVNTPFEEDWDSLGRYLLLQGEESYYQDEIASPVWSAILNWDVLAGVGSYGLLLVGTDDGLPLDKPAAGVEEVGSQTGEFEVRSTDEEGNPINPRNVVKPSKSRKYNLSFNEKKTKGRRLIYLRSFPEALVSVSKWETNPASPRYGMPTYYKIDMNCDEEVVYSTSTPRPQRSNYQEVHWTRCLHLADTYHTASSSNIFAVSRLRPVINHILAARKPYHGGAEGYWKSCFNLLSLETQPNFNQAQITAAQEQVLKDTFEKLMNSLQNYAWFQGMTLKSIAPNVVDPTPHIDRHIEAICIKIEMPVRIFKGSERGELASTQDEDQHHTRIKGREDNFGTPKCLIPFITRLINLGVLRKPKGYSIAWPSFQSITKIEAADILNRRTAAMGTYVTSNADTLIPPFQFLTAEMGYSDEEALAIMEAREEYVEEKTEEDIARAKKEIDGGIVPDPTEPLVEKPATGRATDTKTPKKSEPASKKKPIRNADGKSSSKSPLLKNNRVVETKGGKWRVVSRTGKNLGTFDTREEAKRRLQEVEYFKHKKD